MSEEQDKREEMQEILDKVAAGVRTGRISAFSIVAVGDEPGVTETFTFVASADEMRREDFGGKFGDRVIRLLGLMELVREALLQYVEINKGGLEAGRGPKPVTEKEGDKDDE